MSRLVTMSNAPVGDTVVSRLGFGASGLGGMFQRVSDEDATAAVLAAVDSGVTYFDVAPFYGHGTAESRLGRVLTTLQRSSFTLSTKVGRLIAPRADADTGIFVNAEPSDAVYDYSRDGVHRSLEASLQRLGLDSIDIVYIHDPDDHERQAMDEAYPALEELRAAGVVKAIGVGMNQSAMPARFVSDTDIDVVLLAGRYTLLDTSAERDLLPLAVDKGVAIVNAGVFNSGILASPRPGARYDYAPASDALVAQALAIQQACSRHNVPISAAAIQYSLACPAVASVLVGCRSAAQHKRNVANFELDISELLWRDLAHMGIERWPS
jgi:D-threo-aldose 1-dehydrogenase